jgi:hypothetical protein
MRRFRVSVRFSAAECVKWRDQSWRGVCWGCEDFEEKRLLGPEGVGGEAMCRCAAPDVLVVGEGKGCKSSSGRRDSETSKSVTFSPVLERCVPRICRVGFGGSEACWVSRFARAIGWVRKGVCVVVVVL